MFDVVLDPIVLVAAFRSSLGAYRLLQTLEERVLKFERLKDRTSGA